MLTGAHAGPLHASPQSRISRDGVQHEFWEQWSVAMCGRKSPGTASSWLYRDTSVSPSIARGDTDLLPLGLALPGASQGPLKSWRQAQSTCWGCLGGWHCGKTCALRGQLKLTRPCPAISEMPPRAAIQEPMRHCLGDMRKARESHGPQTPDQPQSQPLLSARPGVPAGGSGAFHLLSRAYFSY